MLGIGAVEALLREHGHVAMPDLVDVLVQSALKWAPRPEDDITVVALRHHAGAW
jgi:hypothetical protein